MDCEADCSPAVSVLTRSCPTLALRRWERLPSRDSTVSSQLARLSALDSALGDPLGSWSRQCFAAAPSLLGKRFIQLHRQCCSTAGETGNWPLLLQGFCTEMRETLLAEIDARLLPALGLIEAVNAQIEVPTYDD